LVYWWHFLHLKAAGLGWPPDRVSLSDPQIQPLVKAMDQVDRASLGFTPVTTNAQISLELHSGGPYDAMLHVYGATSRTIAFRKNIDWLPMDFRTGNL